MALTLVQNVGLSEPDRREEAHSPSRAKGANPDRAIPGTGTGTGTKNERRVHIFVGVC